MNRAFLQSGCVLTLTALVMPLAAVTQSPSAFNRLASVTGLIRDSEGVPQMGALVEALLPDATVSASAITDSRGQYHLFVQPGRYRIRATASLLLPAVRERLLLADGSRSIVDLTLSTVLAPGGWLPVSRRTSSEPSDDWMWTLRSSAGRSILRLTEPAYDPATGAHSDAVTVSSSQQESRRGATGGRITLKDSDGGFGRGGSHNVLVLTRVHEDGGGAVLRTDFSGSRSPYPVAPSAEISVGMQRQTPFNGYSRMLVTYSSHPELLDSRGLNGMQGVTLRSGQRIELGDTVRVDVGSVMRVSNLHGNAFIAEPFFRVAAQPGSGVVLAYSMTAARGTESLEDMDRVQAALPVAVLRQGHLRFESGTHQAFSIAGHIAGGGQAEVTLYRDQMRNPLIAGVGVLSGDDAHRDGLIADPTTHTYRVTARDYAAGGVRVGYRHPVTKALWAGAEMSTGSGLRSALLQGASMAQVLDQLTPASTYTASAYADGRILATGTTVHAGYRWQPVRVVTAVDAFRANEDGAYLSCSVRQSLGKLHFLPRGLEALVDVQNLLAQGYQPFVSSDGQTLYLAQTPRTLQAGVSFSF